MGWSGIVRLLALVLTFGIAAVATRVLDRESVAQLLMLLTLSALLGLVCQAGVPRVVAQRVGIHRAGRMHVEQLRSELGTAVTVMLGLAVLVAIAIANPIGLAITSDVTVHAPTPALLLVPVHVLARSLVRVFAELNRGFGAVVISSVDSELVGPGLGVVSFVGYAVFAPTRVSVVGAYACIVAAWVFAAGLAFARSRRYLPQGVVISLRDRGVARDVLGVFLAVTIANALTQQVHLLIAALVLPAAETALVATAWRAAQLVGVPLVVVSATASPDIGIALQSDEGGRQRQLQQRLRAAAGLGLVAAAGLATGYLLMGDWLLTIAFGNQYAAARWLLVALSLGPLVSVWVGPAGLTLILGGRQARLLVVSAVGLGVTVLAVLLGEVLGGDVGLALGYSVGLIAVNVTLLGVSRQDLGLDTHASVRAVWQRARQGLG